MRSLLTPAVLAVALTPAIGALAAVPPRTPSGLTLEIPPDHADAGTPFYVVTGADTQLTFISNAPFERISGTSGDIVGYIIMPDLGDAVPSSVAMPGAFRLPVASIDTGLAARNGHLQSGRWLNAESFPDITFELREARDINVTRRDEEKKLIVYSVMLVGDMTIMDTTKELAIPARITTMEDAPRQMRGGGALLALNCDYTINLHDFAPGTTDRNASVMDSRVASEIDLSQFLLLRPSSPDAQIDGLADRFETTPEIAATIVRFQRLLIANHNPDAAYTVGEELLKAAWDNANVLTVAATLATSDEAERKDMRYALRAATRASELTDHADPRILGMVAGVYHQMGDLTQAITWQRKAVEHIDDAPKRLQTQLRSTLEQYEAEAG